MRTDSYDHSSLGQQHKHTTQRGRTRALSRTHSGPLLPSALVISVCQFHLYCQARPPYSSVYVTQQWMVNGAKRNRARTHKDTRRHETGRRKPRTRNETTAQCCVLPLAG